MTIEKCTVSNLTVNTPGSVGAIIGHCQLGVNDSYSVKECTVKDCSLTSTDNGDYRVGFVVGTVSSGKLVVSDCDVSENNTRAQSSASTEAPTSVYYGRCVSGGSVSIDGTVYP